MGAPAGVTGATVSCAGAADGAAAGLVAGTAALTGWDGRRAASETTTMPKMAAVATTAGATTTNPTAEYDAAVERYRLDLAKLYEEYETEVAQTVQALTNEMKSGGILQALQNLREKAEDQLEEAPRGNGVAQGSISCSSGLRETRILPPPTTALSQGLCTEHGKPRNTGYLMPDGKGGLRCRAGRECRSSLVVAPCGGAAAAPAGGPFS